MEEEILKILKSYYTLLYDTGTEKIKGISDCDFETIAKDISNLVYPSDNDNIWTEPDYSDVPD